MGTFPAILRAACSAAVLASMSSALATAHAAGAALPETDAIALGRALYLDGKGAGGAPLRATRAGGFTLSGAAAACVNCHRRSGLGGSEGRSYIPPINAASLFAAHAPGTGASASGLGRPAYDEPALARAIRGGVDPVGRQLEYLMPRYELNDAELESLVAYLRRLSTEASPGVGTATVDFATVVTPGTEPGRSKAMLDVLHACFDEHNAGQVRKRRRTLLAPEMSLSKQPQWRLNVWQLEGAPETWDAQLAEFARRRPVFALVSGLGGGKWRPVHQFCEHTELPCLYPHVEAPESNDTDSYALYMSRGVLLEAGIVAGDIVEAGSGVKRVVQVLRADDEAARAAAGSLRRALRAAGIEEEERRIDALAALDAATKATAASDALILWLRPDDLKRLNPQRSPAARLYLSGTLADFERAALPAAWKADALMAYPYELPQKRISRTAQFKAWLRARGLALVDEPVQSDAYLACSALRMGMNELAGHPQRDYLVERLQVLTEQGGFVGNYPSLSLGIGQQFASKSGYLVRFEKPDFRRIAAVGERVAP